MTDINRVLPYTSSAVTRGVFKCGEAGIKAGDAVYLSAANTIKRTTATLYARIGYVDYDAANVAYNETGEYSLNDMVSVVFINAPVNTQTFSAITLGEFVKSGVQGSVAAEATGTVRTVNTTGIALETTTGTNKILIVPLA